MKHVVLLYGGLCKVIMCGVMYSGYFGNPVLFNAPLDSRGCVRNSIARTTKVTPQGRHESAEPSRAEGV